MTFNRRAKTSRWLNSLPSTFTCPRLYNCTRRQHHRNSLQIYTTMHVHSDSSTASKTYRNNTLDFWS